MLDAGAFDGDSGGTPVGPRGWDYAHDLAVGDVAAYRFDLAEASVFFAVLIWRRFIDDAWMSFLPDHELAAYNHGGGRVAYSNSARFRQPQAIQRNNWDRSLRRLKQLERPEGRQHTRLIVKQETAVTAG